jgi:hypothetical protein
MARGVPSEPGDKTATKLREVQDRLTKKYGLTLSDADIARVTAVLSDAIAAEAMAIEAELLVKPIVSARFRASIGPDVPTGRIAIVAGSVIALLLILLVGIYLIVNSPGAARLWK